MSVLVWRATIQGERDTDWVVHTLEVQMRLESALGHAANADARARVFAETGQEAFLDSNRDERRGLAEDLDTLRHLTADNASQQRRLDRLGLQVNASTQSATKLEAEKRRTGTAPPSIDLIDDKRRMEAVQATVGEMQIEEARLHSLRVVRTHAARFLTQVIVVSSGLTGAALAAVAGLLLLRGMSRSARMQGQLRVLNAELEQRSAENVRAADGLREANRALFEGEGSFRLLLESVTDYAIYQLDPEGRVITWNTGAERNKGYKAEEVLGRNFSIFFTAEDAAAGVPAKELAAAARDGRYETEALRMRKDGSRFWAQVTVTAIRGADGELKGFAKVTRNVTAQKEASENLRSFNAQLEQYRIMVENIDEYAIYSLDAEGLVTSWGAGAQKVIGYAPEDVLGRHYSMFASDEDRLKGEPERELAEAARTGRFVADRWRICRDGSMSWASGVVTAVKDESGQLTGFIRVARDMTRQKLLEESLERLAADLETRVVERTRQLESTVGELRRKNQEVEAFVYIVSHDLRAPLVNVQGFARELELNCASLKSILAGCALADPTRDAVAEILDEEIAGALRFISASASKFERLIDALLGLSRHGRQVYQIVEVDVEALVASSVASLQQSVVDAGAKVAIGALPRVHADATALGQVFSNLIGNSLKYRSPGRPLKVEIGGDSEAGAVHFWVRDNGLGIPESGKSRLFQVFQRFHPQHAPGEGMGLAIVHRIVERHGGNISAESQEGKGTTFHFSLPRKPRAAGGEMQEGIPDGNA